MSKRTLTPRRRVICQGCRYQGNWTLAKLQWTSACPHCGQKSIALKADAVVAKNPVRLATQGKPK